MRIAYVTQWFPPEPGTVVASAIADGLAARGHHVDVLTGFPNYPDGQLQEGYPLRYYRRDQRSERVTVHRFPLVPSHDGRALPRALNYLSFALSAAWVSRRRIPAPDVWLVYSSPATAAVPALLAPRRKRAPVSLVIQDLWPDSVTDSGFVQGRLSRVIDAGLHRFCRWTYRRSATIGVISPGMRSILIDRGVPDDRIFDTPNHLADSHVASPDSRPSRADLGLPDGRLFMYAGNVGELQGLEPLVRAFADVPSARLVIIGGGVALPDLKAAVSDLQADNVSFIDTQPSDRIGAFIAASDVQIVSLKDTPLLRATMPSKAQGAMAAGRPVLAHLAGDVADLVERNNIGAVAPPADPQATRDAIRALCALSDDEIADMGQRSRAVYDQNFASEAGLDRLEAMLAAATGHRSDTTRSRSEQGTTGKRTIGIAS